jgi:hypothetical protein
VGASDPAVADDSDVVFFHVVVDVDVDAMIGGRRGR